MYFYNNRSGKNQKPYPPVLTFVSNGLQVPYNNNNNNSNNNKNNNNNNYNSDNNK